MWNAIYKKLWLVILLPLLAGGIAWFFTGQKANQYKSVAVIEASIPEEPTKTDAKTLKDIQEPDAYYENLVETMKTEVITSMASYRLLLHDLEQDIAFRPPAIQYSAQKKDLFKTRLQKKISSFGLLSESDPTEETIFKVISNTDYNLARWIRDKQLTIEHRPGSSEILVSSLTEDPFLSAFAANAISQEYIRYQAAISAPLQTNDSVGYYREEVDRLKKDVDQKTTEVNEASKTKTSPVNDVAYRRVKADRIAEFEMRIVEEEWEVNNLRDQLGKIERPDQPVQKKETIDVATNAKIQTIRNKIDQLSRLYAEGGSKDRQLDSVITRLRKQLNDETVRLQTSSRNVASTPNAATSRDREMLNARISRHEENIASLRNDIRRLKNTAISTGGVNTPELARLQRELETVNKQYTLALDHLRKAEINAGPQVALSRERHHLILKEKALPSAEPESPWAMAIVLSAFLGTLAIVLIYVVLTRPAPTPTDDIFLRVNYANQRRMNKKKHPHEEDVSLSNNQDRYAGRSR
ncbi:MAG TPA: hypothetical protein VFE50_04375 [Cyclobacteriaceae bacterium]|nr:hypothetical protein [Cyclobacteriaceae bacterium]